MKHNKLFTLCLAIFVSLSVANAAIINGTCGDNLTWSLNTKDSTLVIEGSGNMYNWDDFGSNYTPWYQYQSIVKYVTLPHGLVNIGDCAFYNCGEITSIILPNTLTSIGGRSFSFCWNLKSIQISENLLTIGSHAFWDCANLEIIELPNSLTTIESGAFMGCSSLINITFGSNLEEIGENIFYDCSNLTAINVVKDNLFYCSEDGVLYNKAKTTLVICPGGKQGEFYFPSSITDINYNALGSCSRIYSIKVSTDNTQFSSFNGVLYSKDFSKLLFCPRGKEGECVIQEGVVSICDEAFYNCNKLTSITLPNTVASISGKSFSFCWNLKSIQLSENLLTIGSHAFWDCGNLEVIELPNSLTTIESGAFMGCSSLSNITLGSNLSDIGEYAFHSCSNITAIHNYSSVPQIITNDIFNDVDKKTCVLYVPAESIDLYRATDGWKVFNNIQPIEESPEDSCILASGYCGAEGDGSTLTWQLTCDSVLIISGNGAIADYNLYGEGAPWKPYMKQFISVIISYGVTRIGNNAFSCRSNSMVSVSLPESLTEIGESAFYGCWNLSAITIPDSVVTIGREAFGWCRELEDVTLPANIELIDEGVFRDCSSLHTIIIPDRVETIKREAFSNTGLSSVTFPSSVRTIGDMAFSDCRSLQSITFNEGNTIIGYGAFQMCNNLSSVTFPNSLTTIGSRAFANCGLSTITIPSRVNNIEDGAFAECSNLSSISVDAGNTMYDSRNNCNAIIETSSNTLLTGCVNTIIPETVTGIGGDAFHGCYGLDSIHIPDGIRFLGESAFAYSSIQSITLPGSIRTIGNKAFDHCSQLTSISLSEGLDTIGYAGIYACDRLKSIVLPHSLKSIDSYGFGFCNQLTSVEFLSATPPSIGNYGCFVSSPCMFIVPCGSEDAYLNALNASENYSFDKSRFRPKADFSYSIYSSSQVQGSVVITKHITCEDPTLSFRIDIAEGGNFIQWSDGSKDIERTITITQDTAIVALFGRMDCVEASGTCGAEGDNLTWELSCDSVLTISGTGAMEDFQFVGAPWYSYGTRGKIKLVVISEGVTNIGNYAFHQAFNLDSIYIPGSVTKFGAEAFAICGLQKLNIPNTVTTMGEHAFSNCKSLKSVSLSTGLTTISANAFYGCDRLTSVTIPNTINNIGSEAFAFCLSLASIELPNSIQNIGDRAFMVCQSLTSIEIPNSVSYLAGNAFEYCPVLTSIEVANDNPYYCDLDGVVYSKDKKVVVSYPRGKHGSYVILNGVTSIGSNAFSVCDSLTAIDIPHSVNSISSGAFRGCVNLDSVIIPNNVTTIGIEAFMGCKFTSLKIGNNVVNIEEWAFGGNPNLISLEIPNSVKTIGKAAFMDCTGLNNIKVGNGVTNISTFTFFNCSNVSSFTILAQTPPIFDGNAFNTINHTIPLYVPTQSVDLYKAAEQWSDFNILPIDEIPTPCLIASGYCGAEGDGSNLTWQLTCDSVLTIEGRGDMKNWEVMYGEIEPWMVYYQQIAKIVIKEGITRIGSGAFYGCQNATSIEIPNTVTTINSSAFWHCRSLKSIIIPDAVVHFGSDIFSDCAKLTSVILPANISYITDRMFCNCESLATIVIPRSVTSIGSSIFSGCSSLKNISVEAGNLIYDSRDNCNAIIETSTNTLIIGCQTSVIPNNVTNIGAYAFWSCPNLTSIEIPNSVSIIGERAFAFCNSLASVTIPNSVSTIENWTFHGCSGLTSITNYAVIPQTIDSTVFYNVDTSTCTLYVPASSIALYKSAEGWKDFTNILPIEESPEEPCIIASGYCGAESDGSNLTWQLTCDSVLTISGTGAMAGYWSDDHITPWYEFRDEIAHIHINNGVTHISAFAFDSCIHLLSIDIPSSIKHSGYFAFMNCYNLKRVNISDMAAWGAINFVFDDVSNPLSAAYGTQLYLDGDLVTNVIIPENVGNSLSGTFVGYSGLHSAVIPESVLTLYYTFMYCENLVSVTLPNSLTDIHMNSFYGCASLTSIEIPNSVHTIGDGAFAGCYSLTKVKNFSVTPQALSENVFDGVDKNVCTLYVPASSIDLYKSAEGWKDFTNILPIEETPEEPCIIASGYCGAEGEGSNLTWQLTCDSVLTISGTGAMVDWQNNVDVPWHSSATMVKDVVISDNLSHLGLNAFRNCSHLTSLSGPSEMLNAQAFSNIPVKSVVITSGELEENHCALLKSWRRTLSHLDLNLAENISLPDEALNGLYNLQMLVLPKDLTSISYMAVAGCVNLQSVSIPISVIEIDQRAFEDCRSLTDLTFAEGSWLTKIGNWAFYNCHNLSELIIPDGVTEIGNAAFYGCAYAQTAHIPASVQSIGDNAFALCTKLCSMQVDAVLPPTVADKTFYEVSTEAPVYVPENSVTNYKSHPVWGKLNIQGKNGSPTDIHNPSADNIETKKLLLNGQILIFRGEKIYTITGQEVK